MVKGIAVNFESYTETIPKILETIKFSEELKKHDKIILKPNLQSDSVENSTKPEFLEAVLKFIMENKNPGTEVFITEGCDGKDTMETFNELGFSNLSEKYGVGLIDLNKAEVEEIQNERFKKFDSIKYPKILLESFVISLPTLKRHEENGIAASLENMLGVFPSKYYSGFFSKKKTKLDHISKEYQIHDILQCKMPEFTVIDASQYKTIIAGQPFEMDKQAAKALGLDWQSIPHLKLLDQTLSGEKEEVTVEELIKESG